VTGSVRRVVLHAGIGKTGSSALQTAFVRRRDALASYGVRYPEHRSDDVARSGGVTSGNGAPLRRWLVPRDDAPRGLGARVRAQVVEEVLTADARTLLYSSEFLHLARPERLDRLRRELAGHDATLEAVVYVRDLVGHALSSYSQVVKRGLYTGTFADYIAPDAEGGYHLALDRVLALPEVLGHDNVTVLHYDTVRHDLVRHFCTSVLGVDLGADLEDDLAREDVAASGTGGAHAPVNRSFTDDELDLMRHLNRVLTTKAQARTVSDVLIGLPPLGSARPSATPADVDSLHRRFAGLVDQVNEVFFDVPVLSVVGASADVVEAAGVEAAGVEAAGVEAAGVAAAGVEAQPTPREQRLLDVIARLVAD